MERPSIRVIEFEQRPKFNTKTGVYDGVEDWVHYGPAHALAQSTIWEKVEFMKPRDTIRGPETPQKDMKRDFLRHRWSMIEPAYNAWKEGHALPEYGTPLGVWPILNKYQIEALGKVGIRTIEELRDCTDGAISRVPMPGVQGLKQQAGAFLANREKAVETKRVADLEAQTKALQEQLDAAVGLLAERSGGEKPKRGPGRPPKVKEPEESEAA